MQCCSFATPAGSVRLQDFEQQLLDYLHHKHAGDSAFTEMLKAQAGYVEGQRGSVAELLQGKALSAQLLADIERSVESFEEMHRRHGG